MVLRFLFLILVSTHVVFANDCISQMRELIDTSDMFWKNINRRYNQVASSTMSNAAFAYHRAFEAGDENLQFLYELGFRFNEEGVIAANLNHILSGIKSKYQTLVDEGVIDDVLPLRPAIFAEDANFNPIPFEYGAPVPAGIRPSNEAIVLDTQEFLDFIRSGYFPFGSVGDIVDGTTLMIIHDLAHFGSFIQNPEYLRLVRRVADELSDQVVERGTKIEQRLNYINESLTWVKPEERQTVENLLNSISPLEDYPRFATEYQILLEAKSTDELWALKDEVVSKIDGYLRFYGGASRDTLFRITERYNDQFIHYLIIKDQLEAIDNNEQLIEYLSRHFAIIDNMHRLDLNAFDRTIALDRLPDTHPLYRLFCMSGGFDGHRYFTIWCQ